jgi:ABC-type multidrug transport system ATPase subunit
MDEVRKDIGFCPQFDSLSESLTAYENLEMYAKIKGIPDGLVEEVAQRLVELVGLTKFAERQAGTYSGGNKRKLSLAIALIGNPSLVLLDEPSTGMDPVARRQMWLTIERTAATRSVVLTTHSMEECEALCDRVVVMVKGQFRCLGSIQHLKSRFGEGYTVELRIESSDGMADLEKFALEELHATLEENMDLWLKCSVPITELSLASIFGTIEEHKGRLGINDYSVSQTTLEQIFIRFARD